MGGYGSGPSGYGSKITVEECLTLNVDKLRRKDVLPPGGTLRRSMGVWSWLDGDEEVIAKVGYEVQPVAEEFMHLKLDYTVRGDPVEMGVWLDESTQYFGGSRWWFRCPLWVRRVSCGRRIGRLYVPPGGRYFGCRHCYDLTYTSCQDSHKYDWLCA